MPESKLFISAITIEEQKASSLNTYSLGPDDVLIYTLHLPEYIELTKELIHFLNADELDRANRFYREKDRNQFIICRSILKIILAEHANTELKNITLDYHFNKKPYLGSHPWLHFNISHSEDFAVIAISKCKLGIDVEFVSKDFDYLPLLPEVFTENEILFVQEAENKEYAFYCLWTRKEAFVKAIGQGINDDFKIVPALNGQYNIQSAEANSDQNWYIYGVELAECYLAAVAFQSLPTGSKNIKVCTVPKTVEDLLELTKSTDTKSQ
ncbi:4'-phosphopantetheinyl transferase family protein [Flavobacterium nackdongense]|uniref:4'-phosphopantetheinyl transferase superfamily protein n=1 Tax=Flavobacterium nackdongense TaxID=2547394 RepID=A0A4P6YE28_9FLAO|nr:4'-phosphopantetheinyl transferase superfamily protein [Flavobacterium nackdongense]QBN18957.1 4'-phosphopantetheinyl transferase superfamily protein [Flavobacterium nackdongense]